MFKNKLFILPPAELYTRKGDQYTLGFATYSHFNYLNPGIASYIRSRHFECALALAKDLFGTCGAIDFGCADGIFLPSLAANFKTVAAVDHDSAFVKVAKRIAGELDLENVDIIDNSELTAEQLSKQLKSKGYQVAFLLEVLEHVGRDGDVYGPKIELLHHIFDILDKPGRVIISVPNMVGLSFLIQRIAFALLGFSREAISFKNLLKASFLYDTTELEKEKWHSKKHLGFNHLTLQKRMKEEFRIVKKRNLFFQTMFVITR